MRDPLTAEDFLPCVGKAFSVTGGRHALVLTRVDRRPLQDREIEMRLREPFILIFRGPFGDVLPEGLYRFDVEAGSSVELYVMPIHTPARDRQDYQASFN